MLDFVVGGGLPTHEEFAKVGEGSSLERLSEYVGPVDFRVNLFDSNGAIHDLVGKVMPFDRDVFSARAILIAIESELKTASVVLVDSGLLEFARWR